MQLKFISSIRNGEKSAVRTGCGVAVTAVKTTFKKNSSDHRVDTNQTKCAKIKTRVYRCRVDAILCAPL